MRTVPARSAIAPRVSADEDARAANKALLSDVAAEDAYVRAKRHRHFTGTWSVDLFDKRALGSLAGQSTEYRARARVYETWKRQWGDLNKTIADKHPRLTWRDLPERVRRDGLWSAVSRLRDEARVYKRMDDPSLIDQVVRSVIENDGVRDFSKDLVLPATPYDVVLRHLGIRDQDPRADVALNRIGPEVAKRLDALVKARVPGDVARFVEQMQKEPHLSIEEIRRVLVETHAHLTEEYVADVVLPRIPRSSKRPIDRLGSEPNFLLAAQLAYALFAADKAPFDDVVREFLHQHPEVCAAWPSFGVDEVLKLRLAYPFLLDPRLPRPSLTNLTPGLVQVLTNLTKIPMSSVLLAQHVEQRGSGQLMNAVFISADHRIGDKFAFYKNLLLADGVHRKDIDLIWKPGSGIPEVDLVFARCLGLTGRYVTNDAELAEAVVLAVQKRCEARDGRSVYLHAPGVQIWAEADEIAGATGADLRGISHTTSDADQIKARGQPQHIFVALMAYMLLKIEHERDMHRVGFTTLFTAMEEQFAFEFGNLRNRRWLIHGGGGKIIGHAAVRAALALNASIAVVDPGLELAENAATREELERFGVDIYRNLDEARHEIATKRLVAVNCTKEEVWGRREYAELAHDVVTINLGSGRRGFSHKELQEMATRQYPVGPMVHAQWKGVMQCMKYVLTKNDGSTARVYAAAENVVANLAKLNPNLTSESELNNVLVRECMLFAKHMKDKKVVGAAVPNAVTLERAAPGSVAPHTLVSKPWPTASSAATSAT